VIVTTNLPFSEWISVFTDPRLCKAVVERLTYRSHIVETGTDSYRFKASLGRARASKVAGNHRADGIHAAAAGSAAPTPPGTTSDISVATAQPAPQEVTTATP